MNLCTNHTKNSSYYPISPHNAVFLSGLILNFVENRYAGGNHNVALKIWMLSYWSYCGYQAQSTAKRSKSCVLVDVNHLRLFDKKLENLLSQTTRFFLSNVDTTRMVQV